MALQGTLDTFSLPDVLRLLATTGKTGCLHVEGDRGRGNVWLDDGAVVAATAERVLGAASIDEVIFEVMRFGRGSFNFAADEQPPNDDQQPQDVESTLRRATQLLDEWRQLEVVVPSLSHRVALAPELTVDQVTIDAPRWQALVAISAGKSVGELGEVLDQGELAVSRTVSDLVELGVAVIEPPGAARAPAATNRRNAADTSSRSSSGGETSRRSAAKATSTSNGSREARREPREAREPHDPDSRPREDRDREDVVAQATAPSTDNGRSSWGEGPRTPVETAPKPPRTSKSSSSSRSARPRRTGPTPTTVAPSAPTAPTPARNGQTLTGAALSPPVPPSPMPPFPTSPPVPGPAPMPVDRGRGSFTPPGSATMPVPAVPDSYRGPILPPTLDTGRLGPSPLSHETGPVPTLGGSTFPPDVSWAAEDHNPPPVPAPGPARSPGRIGAPSPGRTPTNGRSDNDTAQHVAAMSPEARSAVEAAIGRSGGGPGGMPVAGASQDQIHARSQLLNFLSSVRP